jgi:hypothetical protein
MEGSLPCSQENAIAIHKEKKVKLSLYVIKYYAMMIYGGVEV